MHKNVDRLTAEEDIRFANVFAMAQSGEGYGKLTEQLRSQVGTVIEVDEARTAIEGAVYERDKLLALKDLGRIR